MTSSEHRARARSALKGKWIWAVLITLLASLLGGIAGSTPNVEIDLPSRSDTNININVSEEFATSDIPLDELEINPDVIAGALEDLDFGSVLAQIPTFVWVILAVIIIFSIIFSLAFSLFVGGPIQVGYRKYTLHLMDGTPSEIGDLFSEFSSMGRAVKYRLMHTIIEFVITTPPMILILVLSALLFESLGGLVVLLAFGLLTVMVCVELFVSYGLVMTDFILADNPECTPADAMRRSWELMNGRRWDYFFLGLSFIGWAILAAFTFGIGGLFLSPYEQVSYASFYRELCPAPAAPVTEAPVEENFTYEALPPSDLPT